MRAATSLCKHPQLWVFFFLRLPPLTVSRFPHWQRHSQIALPSLSNPANLMTVSLLNCCPRISFLFGINLEKGFTPSLPVPLLDDDLAVFVVLFSADALDCLHVPVRFILLEFDHRNLS